jgi:hypothetical protein
MKTIFNQLFQEVEFNLLPQLEEVEQIKPKQINQDLSKLDLAQVYDINLQLLELLLKELTIIKLNQNLKVQLELVDNKSLEYKF